MYTRNHRKDTFGLPRPDGPCRTARHCGQVEARRTSRARRAGYRVPPVVSEECAPPGAQLLEHLRTRADKPCVVVPTGGGSRACKSQRFEGMLYVVSLRIKLCRGDGTALLCGRARPPATVLTEGSTRPGNWEDE